MATGQFDEIGAEPVACYPPGPIVAEHPIVTTYHERRWHRRKLGSEKGRVAEYHDCGRMCLKAVWTAASSQSA